MGRGKEQWPDQVRGCGRLMMKMFLAGLLLAYAIVVGPAVVWSISNPPVEWTFIGFQFAAAIAGNIFLWKALND